MTIFNTARLPQASWKGIKFHYRQSNISGGRKTITHEYPDTNTRYVEDLGKLERTYEIDAVIDTNVSFNDRDKLIKVLEEGGIGTLIHPAFGKKEVVLKNYSLADNTNSLGAANFSLKFEEASLNKMPEDTKGNKGFLANLKNSILGNNETVFNNAWSSVKSAKEKFDSAVSTLSNTANEMQRLAQLVQGSTDTFSDFTTSINEIISGASSLVQTPSVLSNKIRTSFDNLSVAYNSSEDLFDVLTNFFGFDGADSEANGTSNTQKEIKNNQNQIQNIFQVSALALAYNAAANIDYETLDDLSNVINSLEDGYDKLPSNIDKDSLRGVQKMRVETMNIFNNLAISLPKVNDFSTNKTSLNVLIYSLYGSLDRKDQLKQLNKFNDTSSVEGNIKILSNV